MATFTLEEFASPQFEEVTQGVALNPIWGVAFQLGTQTYYKVRHSNGSTEVTLSAPSDPTDTILDTWDINIGS